AAAGRPLRSMSPGVGLRPPPPPLLTRKGLPAATGRGFGMLRAEQAPLYRLLPPPEAADHHGHRQPRGAVEPSLLGYGTCAPERPGRNGGGFGVLRQRSKLRSTGFCHHRKPPIITGTANHGAL